jgi:two-component system sensor histidine kinase TctE
MHLELLLRRELSPDVRTEIERMHGATVRASRLANQLLILARAESGPEQGRNIERVDLRKIAGDAASEWAPKAHALDIDLGFGLERADVVGDPVLLTEMVDNLIDNSLRYVPQGGVVTVRTGSLDGTTFLCVEDTGPGIPESERGKVLERFYRIPGTAGEGSGLGLAIVQEVVTRHHGIVDIDVPAGHGGTRICIRFADAEQVVEAAI